MARKGGFLAALIVLATATAGRAQIVQGPEFVISTGAVHLEAAVGEDGSIVFIWSDRKDSPLYPKWRMYTRRFAPNGTALGDAIRIDTAGRLYGPVIRALPGGGYLATFSHMTSYVHEIHGRRLTATGAGDGDIFAIAPDTDAFGSPFYSSLAMTPAGPVVLWHEEFMWARAYDFALNPLGPPFRLSSGPLALSYGADSAATASGFAAVWDDLITPPALRAFDATGQLLWSRDPFAGSFAAARRVARGPAGELAVVGDYAGKIFVSRFSSTGDPQGVPVLVAEESFGTLIHQLDLEFDAAGDLLVVWGATAQPMRVRILDRVTHQPLAPAVALASFRDGVRLTRLIDGRFLLSSRWGSSARAVFVAGCSPPPSCGDLVVDPPCEQCDDGAANSDTLPDACRTDCRAARCGDSVHDSAEECDDANVDDDDGCDAACLVETCGNGRQEGGEGCDDSNLVDDDGCDSTCEPTGCGSGVLTGVEECDDGNTDNGDGCDSACLVEICGNGRLEGGEGCDDGNLDPSDGCEPDCIASPVIDAVLEPVAPLKVRLTAVASVASARVLVRVRNADSQPITLRLVVAEGTCPPGTVASLPDFDPLQAGSQDSIALAPGQRATAEVQVEVTRAALAPVHRRAPKRCVVQVSVGPLIGGAVDRQPGNNIQPVAIDVYDLVGPTTGSESYLKAVRPRSFTIPAGELGAEQKIRVRLRSTEPGSLLGLTIEDGSCPPGALSLLSFDAETGSAQILVRAARSFFTTPLRESPGRCVATIQGSATPDGDASNDAVPFIMNVVDGNDT